MTVASAALLATVPAAARADVALGPVVSPRGPGRVTVAWTSTTAAAQLTLVDAYGARRVVPAASVQGVRRAELSGLAPGSVYTYEVDGRQGRFVAPPGESDEVRVAVFGDARSGHAAHRGMVTALAALAPDVCLATGDLVSAGNALAQWRRFYAIERPLLERSVFLSARGNHDGAPPLFERLVVPILADAPNAPRTWDAVDVGPLHLVLVDTNQPTHAGSPQYQFVRDDLAAHAHRPTIVLLHRPVYSSGFYGNGAALQRSLAPLFERHGVDLVFQGHDHHYQRTTPIRGVTYVVTGGAGAPLRPVRAVPWSAAQESTHHYVVIDASPRRLRVIARRLDGTQLDAFDLDPRANGTTAAAPAAPAPPRVPAPAPSPSAVITPPAPRAPDAPPLHATMYPRGLAALIGSSALALGAALTRRRRRAKRG